MKRIIIFFILIIHSVFLFADEIRWDCDISQNAKKWIHLWSDGRNAAIGPWRYKKDEWIDNLKKYPDGKYSADNKLMIGFYALKFENDDKASLKISQEVINEYPDGRSILNPSILIFDKSFIDPVWSIWAGILVSKDRGGNVKTKNIFADPLSPSQTAVLKYFSHLDKFPRYTRDFAYCLSVLSNKDNSLRVKLFNDYLKDNWDKFVQFNREDRKATEEEYGVYIFNIERIFSVVPQLLAYQLKNDGKRDEAIQILEKFTNVFCYDGWYCQYNELLGDYYFESGGQDNMKKAIQQFVLAEQGWLKEKQTECRKTSIGLPLSVDESTLFSKEYNLKYWENEFNRIKVKIEKAGGQLPVNFNDEIKKLEDFYSNVKKEKTIPVGWNLKSTSYTPEDLTIAIAKNDISSLKKWSKDFIYGTKAIEKLGTSTEGLKALEEILTEASSGKSNRIAHLSKILSALKKGGKLDVNKLLETFEDKKIRKALYNFSIANMPEDKALSFCLQKVKEYANDPDAHVDEMCIFIRGIGNRWNSRCPDIDIVFNTIRDNKNDPLLRAKCIDALGKWILLDTVTLKGIKEIVDKSLKGSGKDNGMELVKVIGEFRNPELLSYLIPYNKNMSPVHVEAFSEYFHCKMDKPLTTDKQKVLLDKITPTAKEMLNIFRSASSIPSGHPDATNKITKEPKDITDALKTMMENRKAAIEEIPIINEILTKTADKKLNLNCQITMSKWLRGYSSRRDSVVSAATSIISSKDDNIWIAAMNAIGNSVDVYNSLLLTACLDDESAKISSNALLNIAKLLSLPVDSSKEKVKEKINLIKDIYLKIQMDCNSASGLSPSK